MTNKKHNTLASALPEARRIHDEKVYLVENRAEKPKEIFIQIRDLISGWKNVGAQNMDLQDVGCATGDFLSYVAREFPKFSLTGLDVSSKMLEVLGQRVPSANSIQASLIDDDALGGKKFDVITCMGVLSIFDSLEKPIEILLKALKPNGLLIVFGMMNEYAMDVLVRCRYSNLPNEPWQIGYNAFSREYYERVLNQSNVKLTYSWRKFQLPFSIPKNDDLLRNWTVSLDGDPFQQIRGTSQLSTQYILQVNLE